ncbi:hypothetical protein [Moritella sp. F3]|uniref:hypothetical protein n=1 Tax=Moritella sp. F3 TaxID=2718882 RepID=UPI0018E1918A|nr:hypothetical protein [Moritella sp. F3]GIC75851.1 hypothetical protein FMO001_05780 [Moritella sp. F1]GIC83856.1 hypothetical protein FMO003_41360 [Moritella sp. F3]
MKRFLLPSLAVVLTSACTVIEEPSHVLLTGANTKVQPVVIKQIIVQPVYQPNGRNSNMAQSMLTKEQYNNIFRSPYTYPYRRDVSASGK